MDQSMRAPRLAVRLARALGLLAVLGILLACGQKGPLYLPGHSKDTPWPLPRNPPPPAPGTAPAAGASPASETAAVPNANASANPSSPGAAPTPAPAGSSNLPGAAGHETAPSP